MRKHFKDDPIYAAIVAMVMFVVLWLLMTPLVPRVAMETMRRFHLRSSNYAVWAAQFPIPAMYNFANRVRFANLDLSENQKDPSSPAGNTPASNTLANSTPASTEPTMSPWRYVNHFPTRVITFADGRYRYMRKRQRHRFELESRYRGQTLRSVYELGNGDDRGFKLRLIED